MYTLGSKSGIALRILLATALAIVAGGITAWVVAATLGPLVFRQHLVEAESSPGTTLEHAELAFTAAGTLTLALSLGASALTSLGASLVLARRISTSLGSMSEAAAQVASGRFEARVPRPSIGREFHQLSDSLNIMARSLDESERLRNRLLADVAHELRTPVATISAYLDALDDDVETLSPETKAVLRSQASRLTRLAADIAAVTQSEVTATSLDRRSVAPEEFLRAAVESVRGRFEDAGVGLHVELRRNLPMMFIDIDRLGQVLTNLLDNALRHTLVNGKVVVSAVRYAHGVRIAVTDNGEGIDPSHLPHIFDRFYRVDTARDTARGGAGIGLSIVRALVNAHGGTVTASSEGRGAGARFTIDLPSRASSSSRRDQG